MDLSTPGGDDELGEPELRPRRKQVTPGQGDEADNDWCDIGSGGHGGNTSGCDIPGCDIPGCDLPGCDIPGCDIPDCDCGGCNLLRLSTVLAMVALVVPAGAGAPVAALIRFYRRWLTRLTPVCPSSPSCSAYALSAVQTLGARQGLAAAARRIRACGVG